MKKITILILIFGLVFIFGKNIKIFAQESQEIEESLNPSEPEVQWLWGEVISVDLAKNTIRVKYLDYDEDKEKEVEISVNKDTTYENINSLNEIKPKDTLSIDYIVSPEGINIAKNICLEKPEEENLLPEQTPPKEEM